MQQKTQVFQATSPSRWQRFVWTFRVFLFLFALLLIVLGIALIKVYNPELPALKDKSERFKAILNPSKYALIQETKINKEYAGFRKFINAKSGQAKKIHYVEHADSIHDFAAPIRAAFYVAWDAQSYFSLKNNISSLNMIVPEWLFIDPTADTLTTNIDGRAYRIIKASGVKVMPMLSNFYKDDFNGATLHRIINDPAKKLRLINSVIRILKFYHFQGLNVDFEELAEHSDEQFNAFMKQLSDSLHAEHLMMSQDVSPFNEDYNLSVLSKYNDYIFLMAYDQHNAQSTPGPISGQKWIEAAVTDALKKIPSEKLVLCIAAYGYDWPKGGEANTYTYREVLTVASESDTMPKFNDDTYNLTYDYTDDDNLEHTVYFTDAATNFNTLRFAALSELAGVSLWRLGSEDSRIWDYYDKNIDDDHVRKIDFEKMGYVSSSTDVDYIGEGEVLDVVSTPKTGRIRTELDSTEMLISEEHYDDLPSSFVVKKYGKADKKMVLTFDDGPDRLYTPQILDILSKEHVPACFFLVGINAEDNIPIVKRIYNEGHEIGSHSFTHPNMATVSHQRAILELNATRLIIECITGHSTTMFRAPYNADSEPETMEELLPVAMAKKYNYLTIGESIDPNDWSPGIKADSIFNRIVRQQDNGNIILLHDAGGDRSATVKALPRIIHYFKNKGYTFTTVSDLVGKKKDEMMPAVPKSSGYYLIQLNYYTAEFGYYGGHFLFSLFIICIILSMLRILYLAVLAIKQHRNAKKIKTASLEGNPLISIIVPAYNEEVNAVDAMKNLLKTTYPNFNIIFVDDGSKDRTYQLVSEAFKDDPRVVVLTKENGGKASALNYGISHTDAEFVLCIDSDTHLLPDAMEKLVRHFNNEAVGAVAGNVKVGNEVNLITMWQSIEYITSQNFDRKAFTAVNAITVVPGAIGAFRKSAIEKAGGFTTDTLAEDCDLTVRILRAGYIVENENDAIALTEAPETIRMFLKQRFRWSFGVMQTFWKNRDALFNSKYGSLGWIALPNILIFQILIPLIAPAADLFMIIGLLTGNAPMIIEYYLLFMLVDAGVAILAFAFEKENYWKLLWLLPQRLIYRWLMLYILFKSIRRAVKGELQHWGVLKRTGNVQGKLAS